MKRTICITIIMLMIVPAVLAGVTNPLPSNMELQPGEEGRFKFQIQAVSSTQDLTCRYEFNSAPQFDVVFDTENVDVKKGTRVDVFGTVHVTDKIPFGTYTSEFCVRCRPTTAPAGASVSVDTCGLPLKVSVVDKRTHENLFVPPNPKSEKEPYNVGLIIVGGIALIVIIALAIISLKKRKQQNLPVVKKKGRKK